jgi:hypothetical protein
MCKLSLTGLWVLSLLGGLDLASSASLSSPKKHNAKDDITFIQDGLLNEDSASSFNNSSSPDSSMVNMVRGYCTAHSSRNSS